MIKIGITGSIASGKTTASKILSKKKGPLFSADLEVKKLYQNRSFQRLIIKKFHISKKSNFKSSLKRLITKSKMNFRKLEKMIHPLVRIEMNKFSSKHKNKKALFYEIPLLIEGKLMKHFDIIIFIKAKKKIRLKRFQLKGGKKKLFNIMNNKQLSEAKKIKFCDYVVVNEKNFGFLKRKLLGIIKLHV